MSKKYLSLEEAAAQIGISTAELNRMREKGAIRAFADRGTWKFKEEEVEKLVRSRQADSDPDVPLRAFDAPSEEPGSGADLLFSDDDISESEPTIIRKGRQDDGGSDSDVRLIFDDSMNVPEPDDASTPDDSDSDVKLAGGTPGSAEAGSDSDVKLVTDTEPAESTGSDSDVQLVSSDSSGDVKVAAPGSSVHSGSDSGKQLAGKGETSAIDLVPDAEGSSIIEDDSGISLAEGSGIALASDSGISLERPNDSGISLSEESVSIVSGDSGISLAEEDSGISLSPEAPKIKGSGSGKSKGKGKGKEPKSLADSDDLTGTIPLMDVPLVEDDDILDTQMEVPMLDDSSDEASVISSGSGDGTSVITLDDEEDQSEYSVTSVKKKKPDLTDEQDVYSGEEAIVEDVDEAEAVDVADEIIGEDDELGDDVFGAEDEDFGDVESGVSSADMPIGGPRVAAPVEQEWGAGTFAGLVLATCLMVACGTVMFDMVRNMWHVDSPAKGNPVSSTLLEAFKGL